MAEGEGGGGGDGGKHHTLILGWSAKIPSLLRQLAVANQSLNGGEITIVAAVELSLMEQEFKKQNIDMLGTTVQFLCGSRHDTQTLRSASIDTASAIIVLAESQDADESDELALLIIRKILKVVNSPAPTLALSYHWNCLSEPGLYSGDTPTYCFLCWSCPSV